MAAIKELKRIRFHGLLGGKNISAVSIFGQQVLVAADEATDQGNVVQVFRQEGNDFRPEPDLIHLDIPGSTSAEMDLEGLAVDGDTVYVLGSHSARRQRTDSEKSLKKNRAILMGEPEPQPARDVLLRFNLDAGAAGPIERASLRGFLNKTEPFKSFAAIASKENGVDAEGLAAWRGFLYIGFRGPVLRGNFTPIIRCGFGAPVLEPEVLFVNLGGRGVRDLARVGDRLLILAGPVGDGPGSYQLYWWDGTDGAPGKSVASASGLQLIGELPIPDAESSAKAEGATLFAETDKHWQILIVFDGFKDAHATLFAIDKP